MQPPIEPCEGPPAAQPAHKMSVLAVSRASVPF
jgi:hypothetical protein